MQVQNDHVVSIDYTLKNDAGEVMDSSEQTGPLAYLHGHQNIIPGLEKALDEKAVGDTLSVSIEPADAYGERDERMIQTVPRSMFQGVDEIEPGMRFQAQTEGGVTVVTIKEVNGDEITLDGNHELAGETLHFDVEIKDVRPASEEEIEHGHVHGPGGHEH
ncbi:peptidylprolyl isomerase [Guyparkeria hydrothermalis]|uniref:Peptidyl-prolyl cis-trans isomerase n=1 Tax=Guyparkeria halophila TaxID=47960 RepID=A0A6I6D1V6_9GAMM|nr:MULTISPECIES: peptidylprolyl isomerase [Guyparkeria]MCL7752044.1 peptidylprolyl isomerase [Guyparkeria hydrothermalis]QGT77853.1 peptidylprolyl isomerase [Guyparkeria halophila]TKA89305.1 peptidylprolyl isomerase [Guyparkeria sp. SB14A]